MRRLLARVAEAVAEQHADAQRRVRGARLQVEAVWHAVRRMRLVGQHRQPQRRAANVQTVQLDRELQCTRAAPAIPQGVHAAQLVEQCGRGRHLLLPSARRHCRVHVRKHASGHRLGVGARGTAVGVRSERVGGRGRFFSGLGDGRQLNASGGVNRQVYLEGLAALGAPIAALVTRLEAHERRLPGGDRGGPRAEQPAARRVRGARHDAQAEGRTYDQFASDAHLEQVLSRRLDRV